MSRVGIFGGTFDPIHLGHLIVASCAHEELGLDRVLFMPAQTPPHKQAKVVSPADDRVRMVSLAIEDDPRFELSDLDLQSDAPSYTSELLERYAAIAPDDEVWFIIGEDSLRDFPTWHEPERILERARLAVARRPGYDERHDIAVNGTSIEPFVDRFDSPLIDISSTDIRARVAQDRPITWFVPLTVEQHIGRNGMYARTDGQQVTHEPI